jgi:hypothetical protein
MRAFKNVWKTLETLCSAFSMDQSIVGNEQRPSSMDEVCLVILE